MSIFPISVSRVPNLLMSQLSTSSLARTNLALAKLNEQLTTGKEINRPSDNAIKAATIAALSESLERSEQIGRNLAHAAGQLDELDQTLGEAQNLMLEAKSIASSQLNVSASPSERRSQARIIDSIISGIVQLGNRSSLSGALFGGAKPGSDPVTAFMGGYRYNGQGAGLQTDLGLRSPALITLGESPLAGRSDRHQGLIELDPGLNPTTRIEDLRGATGEGVTLGVVGFRVSGGPEQFVDLSGADTIQDVIDSLQAAIRRYEADNTMTVLGPTGVGFDGGALRFDVVTGPATGTPPELSFFDPEAGGAAFDLGLADPVAPIAFTSATDLGMELNPIATWETPIGSLRAVDLTAPLGSIRLNNNGRTAVVDLSGAQTLGDIRNAIQTTGLGVRVEIDGERLSIVNEVSGGKDRGLSIEEIPGNELTATRLGLRTLDAGTELSQLNDGRGVSTLTGRTDPITGLPDSSLDVDFDIVLGNGLRVEIDLRPEDTANIGAVIARINDRLAAALTDAGLDPALVTAGLSDGANGIAIQQPVGDPAFSAGITVETRNNSQAAPQLGLVDGSFDPATGILLGDDPGEVRVRSVLTTLIDLRDALDDDNTFGITLAGESLDALIDELAETRALVGAEAQRIDREATLLEDRRLLDQTMQSQLQDLDFIEASSRFSQLQTQLQAGYQVTATINQRTLLDFIG